MPSITVRKPDPEQTRRDTKIRWLTNRVSNYLQIDKSKFQDSFDENSICDLSCQAMFSGNIIAVHNRRLARLKVLNRITGDPLHYEDWFASSPATCCLVLKEYATDETQARLNQEYFATALCKSWHIPDLALYLMYPVKGLESETQDDYLLRAFVTQLGGEVMKYNYDGTFLDALFSLG
ncbi:hypothetical protein N0V90_012159 [Kalmusia sp. IMI 367209]|nr:hypothetical protein N0V90_012159 [Kalmusia sp. IMI 367209]